MSSAAIPTPNCCESTCEPVITSGTPGQQGPQGEPGTNGTDGLDAYSIVANLNPDPQPVMPAEGANETVTITGSTAWISVGQMLYVRYWGWMRVVSLPSDTEIELSNPEDTAAGEYTENAAPGTSLPAGATISPGGIQGPPGILPDDALLASHNLDDLDNSATARGNLDLGSVAQRNEGTGDGEVPVVDDASGLVDDEVLFATAAGIESLSNAAALARLGITNGNQPMILIRQQEADGVDGGTFTLGDWRKVPLNTITVDTTSIASISSNQFTLPAGTYRYEFGVQGCGVGKIQGRLYSVTDSAVIANSYGTVVTTTVDSTESSALQDIAPGCGRFTIATTKTLRLEGRCESTNASFGFGSAASFGAVEIYSYILLTKES